MEEKNHEEINVISRIDSLIRLTLETCLPWVQEKGGYAQFVDPLDGMEISAHYGASHIAASLIIYGSESGDEKVRQVGLSLLDSLLIRWDANKKLPGFHNDFNNFALCVIDKYLGIESDFHRQIVSTVLNTADSNHDTVNWLPMRWFVNLCRFEWTNDRRYSSECDRCRNKIGQATYNDGFIDDRLPKGLSFNLQYDVSTVALLQFLNIHGEKTDISKQVGALLNAVFPDGDINYFGRGTNQFFAWGLWIYLLATSGQQEINRALSFLEERLPIALSNNNILLNAFPGKEKYMWWDYHYCSVYTAHLLLWLILAKRDFGKNVLIPLVINDGSSGFKIYKNNDCFFAIFNGRTEYLAEAGPAVAAAWLKSCGTVCKGSFGPWHGDFGNKYSLPGASLNNYFGMMHSSKKDPPLFFRNKIFNKMERLTHKSQVVDAVIPARLPISLECGKVVFHNMENRKIAANITSFVDLKKCSAVIDNVEHPLVLVSRIKNQYGWANLYQTNEMRGLEWTIVLE